MPGPTVKEILLKWGIDNSNWKKAIGELAQLLEKNNKAAEKAQDQSLKKLTEQKAKLKEVLADQKSETAEIEKQIGKLKVKAATSAATKADAVARLATERAASAESSKQASLQKLLQATQKTLQQEVYTKLMNEKLVTAEINKQNAALRLQTAQQRAAGGGVPGRPGGKREAAGGGGEKGGGFLAGLTGGFTSRLAGTIGFAVLSAEGLGRILEQLTMKVKEFIEATGPLQQVREQFENLAVTSGRDPVKFLDDLRDATHGLVDDISLYRNANTFMQSGIKASQEDIVKLTTATVGLARAQGRDAATAVQALNRFFLTGRSVTLSYVTGIQRTQLQVQGMGRAVDSATRSTLAFKQAQEVIVAQFEAIGEPALTFTDRLKQLEVAQNRFWEEITLGVSKSQGFKIFLEWLGQLAEKASKLAEKGRGWGETFGQFFVPLLEAGKALLSLFDALNNVVEGLYGLIAGAFPAEAISDGFVSRLSTVHDLTVTTAQAFVLLRGAVEEFSLRAEYTLKEAGSSAREFVHWLLTGSAGLKKMHDEQARLHDEFTKKLQESSDREYADLVRLEGQRNKGAEGKYKIAYAAPSNVYTAEQSMAAERKIAKSKEEIAIETAKIQLEMTQIRIKKEEELLQVQYEQGLLTIKEYLARKADLELQDHNAKLRQLKEEFDAKMHFMDIEQSETRALAEDKKQQAADDAATRLASIEKQRIEARLKITEDVAGKVLTPEAGAKYQADLEKQFDVLSGLIANSRRSAERMAAAETAELDAKKLIAVKKYYADVLKEQEGYQQKGRQVTEQGVRDEIAARQRLSQALLEVDKARIAREREETEYEFQQGEIGAQEYLDKRIQFAEQDFKAVKDAAERKLAENKNSETAQAEFSQKMAKAAEEREKALTKLSLDEIDIRTKAVEQSYDRAQKLIDSQIKYQQSLSKTSYFGGKGEEQSLIEAQIALLKSRLEQEVKSLSLTQEGSAAWFQQYEKIQSTKAALIQYNEELIKSRDISTGIASALKEMSQAAGKFPKIGAQRVSKGLETLAGGLEEQERYRQRQATRAVARQARAEGRSIAPVTPEEIFKSLQKVSQTAGEDIGKHLKAASDSVEEWRKQMVISGLALDDSIVKTTKALLGDLIPAIQKVADAADGAKPSKYDSGVARAGSGPATAGSPLGTETASDLETMQPAWLTSMRSAAESGGMGGLGGIAQQAATGLAMVAQHAKNVGGGFKNLISSTIGDDGLLGAFKNMGKDSAKASEDLSSFADQVSSIAGNIGGLVSAGKGTGGAFQAGMQGMSSGAGLGGQIGGMFGPMGGMIGTAVGAGAGLVMGVFAGKAKKEAENIAKRITASFNAVLVEVSQGTLGLGSAVQQEIATIQSAVQQLSGKKGGRDELKQILPQMEQQLQQLQAQQQSIIKGFDKQLEVASAPEASQALVQPIQQIIDTYQQYVLAGGNVELANKYLQNSFRSLVTQGLEQLNQSEQDAINNALNYNDLLLQRQELIQNTNQQIQDIMSRGVAVRQMPEGVTKARELQQLMQHAMNQQTQLDKEIAVSKHKLDNESRIFQLATTRVGLETQLIDLQNAQTDKTDAATQALLREVAAYSQGTPTNLPTALDMIGLGSTYISPGQEPGLMPQPPVKTGIWEIDLQNQLQYQQALAYYRQQANLSSSAVIPSLGLAGVPGGNMGVTPAGMNTAATTSSAMILGGVLDSMASNISALVQGLSMVFGISLPKVGATTTTAMPITKDLGMATVRGSSPIRSLSRTGIAEAAAPLSDIVMAGVQTSTDALVSTTQQRQTIEQNISDLSAARVSNETQLVSLKMKEINADMQRISAWNDLLKVQVKTSGAQPQTLEDMLQAVYQTRARQGFGGFVGETSNPT